LTTSAAIVADPKVRFTIVEAWESMPDLVTVNQGEPGIVELCELLLSRGVGIEAGLLSSDDARAFVRSGLAGRCRRVLIEPLVMPADITMCSRASDPRAWEDHRRQLDGRWRLSLLANVQSLAVGLCFVE
jgi:hypothetical protein